MGVSELNITLYILDSTLLECRDFFWTNFHLFIFLGYYYCHCTHFIVHWHDIVVSIYIYRIMCAAVICECYCLLLDVNIWTHFAPWYSGLGLGLRLLQTQAVAVRFPLKAIHLASE